jgi:hypothetical protein
MKPLLFALVLLTGCSDNANLQFQLSHSDSRAHEHQSTILFSGYGFQIHRINIDGVNYLANTRGGLIRE